MLGSCRVSYLMMMMLVEYSSFVLVEKKVIGEEEEEVSFFVGQRKDSDWVVVVRLRKDQFLKET